MEHKLPELQYPLGGLAEKGISKETMEFHYGRHHAGYVKKLNGLIKGTEYEDMGLEDIIKKADGAVFNNAAQHWNHSFFWKCLCPEKCPEFDEGFNLLVNKNFGSFGELKTKFSESALSLFGSGWTWLVDNGDETLSVINTGNAGNPLAEGKKPILVMDVWEHAYYIDYRNKRADYIEAAWSCINWKFVMDNHQSSVKL